MGEEGEVTDLQDLFKSSYDSTDTAQYKWDHFKIDSISLEIRLLIKHKLWGHYIWNASKVAASLLLQNADQWVVGKSILEFGAGSSIPSLIASCLSCSFVCSTDYNDPNLVDNIKYNFNHNKSLINSPYQVIGFNWGDSSDQLLELNSNQKYDLVILADLVFNHIRHRGLLTNLKECLKRSENDNSTTPPFALVTFTPHRPKLLEEDLNFFRIATNEFGFEVVQLNSVEMGVMFEEDPGDARLRSTVFVYTMRLR